LRMIRRSPSLNSSSRFCPLQVSMTLPFSGMYSPELFWKLLFQQNTIF
jgi:hypothetical protein